MTNKFILCFSILYITLRLSYIVAAQTGGNYSIKQSVIASGGGTAVDAASSIYSVNKTIGQFAAGTVISSNQYSLTGVFWSATNDGTFILSAFTENFPSNGGTGGVNVTTGNLCRCHASSYFLKICSAFRVTTSV